MSGACWNALSWPPTLGPQMLATFIREQGQRRQEALQRKMHIDAGGHERAHCYHLLGPSHLVEIPDNIHQGVAVLTT